MRAEVTFFDTIPIELPHHMILTRLGYRTKRTILSGSQRESLEQTIAQGFILCEPQGCWRRLPIVKRTQETILLQNGLLLHSRSLAEMLQGSVAVALMASTVGATIVKAAAEAMTRQDGVTAVIFDAVGGQSANAAMAWINELVRRQISRSGERLTSQRFSPGYGDFGLENQPLFHQQLELDRLGLHLTSRCMLVPEKSVTAVAGIQPLLPGKKVL